MREMKIGIILSDENRKDELELQEFFAFLETEKLCPEFHFTMVSSDSFFDRARRAELCSCSYLYYRRSNGDNDIVSDAKVFAENFSRVSGMMPQEYAHVDAIKWDLLLEIARAEESGNALRLERGEAKLKGRVILQLENVPIYGKNGERSQSWKNYAKLEKTIQKLKADFVKNQEDELFKELVQTTNQFNDLSKELDQMDQAIYKSCQLVLESRKRGAAEDPRLLHAGICMSEGNIEEANEYLKDNSWYEEVSSGIKTAQDAKKQMRSYVAGQRLLISNLQAAIPEKDQKKKRQDEIEEIYQRIVPLAEGWQVEMDLLHEYAWFLFDISNYEKGIPQTKRLIHYLELWPDRFTVCLSEILYLQGSFYEMILDFDSSEKVLNEAQTVFRRKENPTLRERENLIEILNRLGAVYWRKHLFDKGLFLLKNVEEEILELQKQPNYDGHYDEYLGTNYHRQASLYRRKNEFSKSQHFFRECINIRKSLMEKDFYRYALDLSTSYNNYALFCKDINQFQKAEELYREAIKIRQKLAREKFGVYEASAAVPEGNYATLLDKERRDSKAEQYYQEAMSSKRKYCEILPKKWRPSLAYTCIDYGNFLAVRGRTAESEALFEEAISIRKELNDSSAREANPGDTFRLALAYGDYGYLLCRSKRWEKALNTLEEALQTQQKLIEKNGYPASKSYFYTNINYANALDHFDRRGEACQMLQKCIREFEEISAMDELTAVFYTAPIALAKKTLAHLLAKENHLSDAEQNCAEAMEAQRRLAAEAPQVYELDLGLTYREMSQILEKRGEIAQAQEYWHMAEEILAQYPELPEDYISDLTVR